MINGTHILIFSKKAAADKRFFKEVLKCPSVDVGAGWLIFGLPPSELAFHPASVETSHEFYLMCDDIHQFVEEMKKHNIECARIKSQAWGLLTEITLPGGGKMGVYQPRHARPTPMKAVSIAKKKTNAKGRTSRSTRASPALLAWAEKPATP